MSSPAPDPSSTVVSGRGVGLWSRLRAASTDIGLPLPLLLASIGLAAVAASILIEASTLGPSALRRALVPHDRAIALELVSQRLVMTVAARAVGRTAVRGFATAGEGWAAFTSALDDICPQLDDRLQAGLVRLPARCHRDDPLRVWLGDRLRTMPQHDTTVDPAILEALVADRDEVVALHDRVRDQSLVIERRLTDDFAWAFLLLKTTAAGFALSGLALPIRRHRCAIS